MGLLAFAKRQRRKLAVAVAVSAAVYWAVGYAAAKLRELQEQLLIDRLTREDLERRFEQNQKDATFTTLALFPKVSTQILDEFDVEETRKLLQELRHGNHDLASSQELRTSQDLAASAMSSSTDASLHGSIHGPLAGSESLSASVTSGQLTGSSFVATPSKAELWQDIKIGSLTRVFVLIYSAALLSILTRIQLNILGRVSYAASMETSLLEPGSVSEAALLADEEQHDALNRQYLTFSWWVLHEGWKLLAQRVQTVVEAVTAEVEPPTRLSFSQMEELLARIHRGIDEHGSGIASGIVSASAASAASGAASGAVDDPTVSDILLPPPDLETFVLSQVPGNNFTEVDSELRAVLDETKTILASSSSTDVLRKMVHNALAVFVAKLQPVYEQGDARLASALMVATVQARQMAAGSPLSNEYIEAMVQVPELDALSAAIYSDY